MRDLGLVLGQIRYQNRLFWRSPVGAFFTLLFPLMFLVLFAALFDGDIDLGDRGTFSVSQFFAPALAVFAAASATYTNIGVTTAISRDLGILKRFRGTPIPPWVYMAGRVGSAVWIALIGVVLMMSVGAVVYDVQIRAELLPAAVVTFVFGTGSFAALGLALAALVRSGDSAPAVANATILPMAFVSDVFIAVEDPPRWLEIAGDVLPLKHFVRAFQDAFSPFTDAPGVAWEHLGVMAVWGAIGAAVALWKFTWEPATDRPRRAARSSDG